MYQMELISALCFQTATLKHSKMKISVREHARQAYFSTVMI